MGPWTGLERGGPGSRGRWVGTLRREITKFHVEMMRNTVMTRVVGLHSSGRASPTAEQADKISGVDCGGG